MGIAPKGAIRSWLGFALRANQSINKFVIAVPEPRSAYFLLLVSRSRAVPALPRHSYIPVQHPKVRKEKDTPVAAPLANDESGTLRSSGKPRASRTRRRAKDKSARSGSNTVSRRPAAFLPVLDLLYGDPEQKLPPRTDTSAGCD